MSKIVKFYEQMISLCWNKDKLTTKSVRMMRIIYILSSLKISYR